MMKKAFTLAEVLTTLTVIGIVAAIVIPSLITDINEKAFDTQRKALYARFSQAIPLMPKIAGYGTLNGTLSNGNTAQSVTADTAAESFITEGLSKVMKMNNVCYSDNLSDCNFPETFTTLNGSTQINLADITKLSTFNPIIKTVTTTEWGLGKYEQLDTKAAAFETVNGESILVYYNPNCQADLKETTGHFSQPKMCANFVYDLNGSKAPNTVGKDIGFITVLYPTDSTVVAPVPLLANAGTATIEQTNASAACKAQDSESRVPTINELSSMFYNRKLVNIETSVYWSSTTFNSGTSLSVWGQSFTDGHRGSGARTLKNYVRCIKK